MQMWSDSRKKTNRPMLHWSTNKWMGLLACRMTRARSRSVAVLRIVVQP